MASAGMPAALQPVARAVMKLLCSVQKTTTVPHQQTQWSGLRGACHSQLAVGSGTMPAAQQTRTPSFASGL